MRLTRFRHGFGLIEVLIAAVLVAGIALSLIKLFTQSLKVQKHATQSYGSDNIRNNLEFLLKNKASCLNTLSGLNPTTSGPQSITVKDSAGNTFLTGSTTLTDGIRARSATATFLQMSGGSRQVLIEVQLEKAQQGGPSLGRDSWEFKKYVNAIVTGSAVTSCLINDGGLIEIEKIPLNHATVALQYAYRLAAANSTSLDSTTQTLYFDRTDLNATCDWTLAGNWNGCVKVPYAPSTVTAKGSYISFQASGPISATYQEATKGLVPMLSLVLTCGTETQSVQVSKWVGNQGQFAFGIHSTTAPIGFVVSPGDTCTLQAYVGWVWTPNPPTNTVPPAPSYVSIFSEVVNVAVSHYR